MYELIYPFSWDTNTFPIKREQLAVYYSEEYARKSCDEIERLIQAKKLHMSTNSSIYAGRKFRLGRVNAGRNHLEIYLGPTDYLEYLITNHDHEFNLELISRGIAEHGSPDAYLSNALGNIAIVSTLDGKVALLLRSPSVATFSGYYDMPGGHPEPEMVSAEPLSSRELAIELFESIIRETTDELNIQREAILDIGLQGLIRNLEDGRKPEMIFYMPINLDSENLINRYGLGGKEQYESSALIVLDPAEARVVDLRMTAPTRAALEMLASIHKGGKMRSSDKDHPRLTSDRFAAIIFDFDGVIVDSERAQLIAWRWALQELGLDTSGVEMRHTVGLPDEDIVKTLVQDSSGELRAKVLRAKVEKMREMYREGKVALVTGIEDFIRRKSKSHILAVTSNSCSGRVGSILEQHDLARYFQVVVTAEGKLPPKPNPAIYLETLLRLGKLPSECIVIEDSIAGLEAARAAGIYTVAITTGLSRQELSPYADWVIDSFAEIE